MKNATILKLVLVQQLGGRQPDFRDLLFFFYLFESFSEILIGCTLCIEFLMVLFSII